MNPHMNRARRTDSVMMRGVRGSSWVYEVLLQPEGRVSPFEISMLVTAAGMELTVGGGSLLESALEVEVVVAVHAAPYEA